MTWRREGQSQSFCGYLAAVTTFPIVVSLCCFLALLLSSGLFVHVWSAPLPQLLRPDRQIASSSGKSQERANVQKSDVASQSAEKIIELKKQVRELTEKLQLAAKGRDDAQKRLQALGEQLKAGPFGTVKGVRSNPNIIPDESVNPRLAKQLEEVAIGKELVVAIANFKVKQILEVWFTSIKRVGISNYLVVALDNETAEFCRSNGVPFHQRDPDQEFDTIAGTGSTFAVSGLKFRILREFLQLGYSVLLSDVDVVFLQNPFGHLHRDSDVESMTDGHDNRTAYGYNDMFDDPVMGWSHIVFTNRIWVYNSGFLYIRPTLPSIELLDRVTRRLAQKPDAWDQAVFNEELFYPSHPGYEGLHAAKRTMDYYLFMNSKVLFKLVRKDAKLLGELKPVIVHVNYHLEKLPRMKAVVEFYVNGDKDALQPFPVGSPKQPRSYQKYF